ncbi:FGGY-family carbohydrate kinase [Jannaschia seohaensis]|uniref:Xylulokinase n=1 Tax=Jannaschia seohaensis TaxID=475081 RepID=A0A2Y9A7L6_9RHOB|nr:FGGY-family carbohydrate kinase [Jannaschia seohaensis]PWJ21899.1 xylulokinase [Jannaschia seohaensis]SSA38177.1 xylulokinase [Jannaschia seohaensis]
MTYLLGIDIGTFEAKGVLARPDGTVVAQATRAHRMEVPRSGWAEHDAETVWWDGLVALCRELLAGRDAAEVACLALSGIGPCVLPVDAAGDPLGPAILYGVDARAGDQIAAMTERLGAEAMLELSGNVLTTQSVGPKVLWLRQERPELWAKTAAIETCTTFLVRRLTGERVLDHHSAGQWTPFYDARAGAWSAEMCAGVVDPAMLPRLIWTTEIAGEVTGAAAEATGLAPGTPVTAGTIDAAAEAVSVGVRDSGDMMIMYGSSMFMIQVTPDRLVAPSLWSAPWLWPDSWCAMAGQGTSGTLTRWFRDLAARELGDNAFARLVEEAEAVPPGAEGLLCLPYFSGERTPIQDPLAKGCFFGLNLTHGRGHMFRALCEGVAMGTAHVLETYRAGVADPARVLAVGGGVRNAVWLQATSDLGGVAQSLCRSSVGASLGDAFIAGCAVGACAPADVAAWNLVEREVRPVAREVYARAYPLWRELYEGTKAVAHRL